MTENKPWFQRNLASFLHAGHCKGTKTGIPNQYDHFGTRDKPCESEVQSRKRICCGIAPGRLS